MSKIEDIEKILKAITDAEMRLKSIQTALDNADKEIATLSTRKTELEHSINFHKRQNIIPLAHEYKKNKAELIKIKTRLSVLNPDRNKTAQAAKQVEEIIAKFKRDHDNLTRVYENNVLRVLFGVRKNGKK